MLSAGAKKDLLVVSFCHAVLETAINHDVMGREEIPNCKNKNRITRRCERLKSNCSDIFRSNITPLSQKWFKSNLQNRVAPALRQAEAENPQLEAFAIYVLYINFLDAREKKIDEMFKPLLNTENSLFETLDLITSAIGREPDNMYDLAISTLQILKR